MNKMKIGDAVMRKYGNPVKGFVTGVFNESGRVAVEWQSPRRKNSWSTHTTVIQSRLLIPFSVDEQKSRIAKIRQNRQPNPA